VDRTGAVALFGSGETAPSARKVHELLFATLPRPPKIAVLDTPAGFQPNVRMVADKIKRFFEQQFQSLRPKVFVVKAHAKGEVFDPDNPALVDILLDADYIFAGPGSPSYAVRQLVGTRALANIFDRHRAGSVIALASAAAIASGSYSLPVYEIYKAGHPLSWLTGLDLFREHDIDLAVVTHWNNSEGGRELDTSRCYMGLERFKRLCRLLPSGAVVLGIDEHTACVMDFASDRCTVMGLGTVTLQLGDSVTVYRTGEHFSVDKLRGLMW
jgi:cyanophycinase-like exopeptidase